MNSQHVQSTDLVAEALLEVNREEMFRTTVNSTKSSRLQANARKDQVEASSSPDSGSR